MMARGLPLISGLIATMKRISAKSAVLYVYQLSLYVDRVSCPFMKYIGPFFVRHSRRCRPGCVISPFPNRPKKSTQSDIHAATMAHDRCRYGPRSKFTPMINPEADSNWSLLNSAVINRITLEDGHPAPLSRRDLSLCGPLGDSDDRNAESGTDDRRGVVGGRAF